MDGWISTCTAQDLYALQSDSRALACSQLPFEGGLYRFAEGPLQVRQGKSRLVMLLKTFSSSVG